MPARRGKPDSMTRRRAVIRVLFTFGMLLLVAACQSIQTTPTSLPASPTARPEPRLSDRLNELPIYQGAVWVYAYTEYQPAPTDPTQTITATYIFTDTVIETQISPDYIAHIRHEESPNKVPAGWASLRATDPSEWWYVVSENEIYQSFQVFDASRIETPTMTLAYKLPLALGESWCPNPFVKGQPVADCTSAGRRIVVSQGEYATPAGQFDDCFQVTEVYNSGGVTRWLCRGAGLVAQSYDHVGTRFGYTQVLIARVSGAF